ncbi:MAG: hypothetical protein HKL90_13290, partial [Elusimicrobia bacterium]|nr:hypothetical protein [Elusimicrobiota bacterium]
MNKPLPLLALFCALALPAHAGGSTASAPAWSSDYEKGPWDAMTVTGPDGKTITLWVNLQDAGKKKSSVWGSLSGAAPTWDGYKDSGTAPLYSLKQLPNQPGVITYDSTPTSYVLVLGKNGPQVRLEGNTGWSGAPSPMDFASAQGTRVVVHAPA